ncbi:HAD hydrolase-like protein [Vibrio porteresiae]|uniref:HAD hydrolase-like protein n=1 Tax=Vibrio porteresiae DSM 19223 TaxID=1123496 RepID=A0ABZ0QB24_9VIBR|nr:HAD hydrolase-like protein [Vibrio porteresiae]WPC72770.1 HAD hydrolase-like protein [Vibrio porteresiae DSM 19223]
MAQDFIVFDLDGTISDPKDGIVRSINYALAEHGLAVRSEQELQRYIGPPLDSTFKELSNSSDSKLILSLVAKYRERYSEVGFSENKLYEGVVSSLESLNQHIPLAVCTSKRADFAERILTLFEIRHLFEFVNGGDVGITKVAQLSDLRSAGTIGSGSIMVGDRNVDLIAAHRNGLKSVGVLWGYGDYEELSSEQPSMILQSPSELIKIAP